MNRRRSTYVPLPRMSRIKLALYALIGLSAPIVLAVVHV